jgi:hypothetical protein
MNPFIKQPDIDRPGTHNYVYKSDLKIAVQSALAAAFCLGLPAGSFFWLLIVQRWMPSTSIDVLVNFIRDNLAPPVLFEMLGAFGWGIFLSKISGYRQWWWLSATTMAGVWVGDFALYHGFLEPWVQGHAPVALPLNLLFWLILSINVLCVTVSTSLLLGLALMNWKASLMLAASTGLASVVAALVTLIILDGLGMRVGSGHLSMPKLTAASTMIASLAGGTVLGVVFARYVRVESSKH